MHFKEEAQAVAFLSQVPATATGTGFCTIWVLCILPGTSVFPEELIGRLGGHLYHQLVSVPTMSAVNKFEAFLPFLLNSGPSAGNKHRGTPVWTSG